MQRVRLLLDEPQLALSLTRLARLRLEPIHEVLMVRDLTLPIVDLFLATFPVGDLGTDEMGVVAVVLLDRAVVHVENPRRHVVEKPVIV